MTRATAGAAVAVARAEPVAGHRAPTVAGAAPGRRACAAAIAIGLVLPILVVWSVRFPPQFDAPNHLARHFLESLRLRGEPLPPGYEIGYRILPNLGGDLVVPLLLCAFEPPTAWKIFDSLALILFWLGPALFILQQAPHRPAAWCASILFLPFLLSSPFFWGFLNYYSGFGLAFFVLVHLGRLSRSGTPTARGLAVHAALVTLLFFWHLAALVLYGAIAGCLVLSRAWSRLRQGETPRACVSWALRWSLPLVPAVVLFCIYSAGGAAAPAPPAAWGGPLGKLSRLPVVFSGYDALSDLVAGGLWAAALWACFGRALLQPRAHWLLLATVVLMALFFALPHKWRSTNGADTRVLPALIVCALGWLACSLPLRHPRLGLLLLVAALFVRSGSVAHAWSEFDDRLQPMMASLECLPPESRLLPIDLVPGPAKEHPERHFAAHAVILNRAFVPTLFASADQQPLRLTKECPEPWSVEDGVLRVDEAVARRAYDFAWICNPYGVETRIPAGWQRIYSEGAVEVWRIAGPEPGDR